MTWNLGKKDSRCACISVTREQEDWGEYGIHTAHKHKYLFKIIHKRHLKKPKKRSTYRPKAAPDPTWNQKILQTLPRSEKKHFWVAGATIARDKWTPKGASKRDQEQQNPGSICDAKKT